MLFNNNENEPMTGPRRPFQRSDLMLSVWGEPERPAPGWHARHKCTGEPTQSGPYATLLRVGALLTVDGGGLYHGL